MKSNSQQLYIEDAHRIPSSVPIIIRTPYNLKPILLVLIHITATTFIGFSSSSTSSFTC